ncbi:TonB-dependent receptor [Edaphocola aurantiacus]|uniref:TonB-dependent receptor n=1 Tax=Edaphocola aurantiacus TaxID=2601682 RepID=UPI001C941385|nr:TonB-dependent receptor [Edaphocola aurantiacus]
MKSTIVSLSIVGAFAATSPAFAQAKLTLSGFVKESNSQETLPGAVIKVKGSETFVTTNEYGFYSLSLPQGSYELEVYFPGYVSNKTFTIDLNSSQKLDMDIAPQNTLEEVTVTAQSGQVANLRMGTHQLEIDQIKNVPALLGEKDVFKVIKLLPGVQKGQEGSSGFNVRGGGVDQNLIILDDAVVYNASHLFGFFSVFNGDALKGVELIKGGYPAKYGERLSSVLNMTMKEGDKEKFKGEYGIGLLSSRVTIEGPIVKNKASFLLSGRRTYADVLAQPILKAFGESPAGYYFYDMNAKVNYQINDRNSIYLSGYFGRDKFYINFKDRDMESSAKNNFSWGNATGTFRWNMILNPKLFANLTFNYSNYNMSVYMKEKFGSDTYIMQYLSSIDDIGAKYDLSYYASARHTIKAGYKITRHLFKPSVYTTIENQDKKITQADDYISWENNLYIDDEWKITKSLAANLGLRGSSFTTNAKTYFNLEPRASVRYLLNDLTSVKASYTVMNQYMHLVSSTGINMPTDLWIPATERVAPQRAKQYSAGLFRDLQIGKQMFNLSLEGYYKDMSNIVSYKEGASFMSIGDPTDNGKPITFEDNVTSGTGKSYGAELMFQKQKGRFTGWLSYTLSWTKYHFAEINNGEWFYPRHDRRHDVNLVGFYEINKKIRLNALFTFATGNPVMLPRYEANIVGNIPVDGNLSGSNVYNGYHLYTDRNTYRTEAYHRMDLGIQFMKQKKNGVRTWELSFYNVYNRQNPFFYNMESSSFMSEQKLYKYTIFPFIPSITYSFKFS